MSDETPGAGQNALPPREGCVVRPLVDCSGTVRLTQVAGGQYVLTSQSSHNVPALTQIGSGTLVTSNAVLSQVGGVTRVISVSPHRGVVQTSPLRPSQTNQSIVNALTRPRSNSHVRLQVFAPGESPTTTMRSPVKRSLPSTPEKKDSYVLKLQRVTNHRNVRSKIVREKYNEHLLECYCLDAGVNILDLYQFAKRPKTQQFLQYVKEHAIDPKENNEEVSSPPTATLASSLPGASNKPQQQQQQTHVVAAATTVTVAPPTPETQITATTTTTPPKAASVTANKNKTPAGYTAPTNQEQIVEKAKQEAYVVQRISELQKEGLWSEKRLPKVQEQPRGKAHWDFLLEEMVWLAADFAQERKWKKAAARKCARMVQKYFQDKALAATRAEKAQEQNLRRIASFCAKEVRTFWSNVEKIVEYKQHTRLEEKRKKALDQHLSFIVDQTEKYSQLLAEGMNRSLTDTTPATSRLPSRENSDEEFQPDNQSSSDDEETIAQAEAMDVEQTEEVAALQRESQMDFESFLNELPKDYLENREKVPINESESDAEESVGEGPSTSRTSKTKSPISDEDFEATSNSEDDEDTIQEQEQVEGEQNHQEEIDDLKAESEMSIEELRKKYSGLPSSEVVDEEKMSEGTTEKSDESSDDDDESSGGGSDVEMETEEDDSQESEVGLKSLLDDEDESHAAGEDTKTDKNNDLINDAAAIAESIQPKGNTLSSTSVVTPVPFLLKLPLREYQHIGLDWLVTMYERKLNGILADEMGLGKTIQTIALLAHLACEKENWGPHLIIVPTSVMLNWEMECKKWCPAFKILTYYGTQKERKAKRTGWTKPNTFHICITSYKLVIQDHQSFRRKKWKYLILDEAQNIKNFKSQRWQLLLNFQTQQRLLLTGTPLQNNLMELWSLMHFLMPNIFQSHREFKEWFSNPVTGMIEGNSEYNENVIKRLHKVLRPFLLRRLKCEVEKQMPKKYEHIVMCRLSKRQRYLYDDYMSRAKTKETLASGNLLSVINVLMQLRKVCNHPNLFEVRPTISPFQCEGISYHIPSCVYNALLYDVWRDIDLFSINLNFAQAEFFFGAYQCYRMKQRQTPRRLIVEMGEELDPPPKCPVTKLSLRLRRHGEVKTESQSEVAPPAPLPQQQQKPAHNLKLKVPPNYGIQLVSQNLGGQVTNTSVLKCSDKTSLSFAGLVTTPTGKHILLTSNPNIPTNISGQCNTTGQKVTFLSKQPITTTTTTTNASGHQITKAYVKFQLTSVPPGGAAAVAVSSTSAEVNDTAASSTKDETPPTVSSRYLNKLYKDQSKGLDVRWKEEGEKEVPPPAVDPETDAEAKARRLELMARLNERRCNTLPMYGRDFHETAKIFQPSMNFAPWKGGRIRCLNAMFNKDPHGTSHCLEDMLYTPERRIEQLSDIFDRFIVYVPPVRAPQPELRVFHPDYSTYWRERYRTTELNNLLSVTKTPIHKINTAMLTQFPDPRLIQYDCGKLQTLEKLLRKLKSEGHRVLIFTQMTKMLDVLEAFLNYSGHIYLRLDGSTKVDQRQVLMERFNADKRIFVFILSTRSGGIGVNLTGADTVIFYDSDWNPTMDAQAQDRCHRIGQTRDVHIYRLVSERTIEENILKKANQKRLLGDLAIEGGNFTTAYFKSSTIQDLFEIDTTEGSATERMSEMVEINRERELIRNSAAGGSGDSSTETNITGDERAAVGALENALAACEDDQDVQAARTAKAEVVADLAEFDENIPLEDQEKDKDREQREPEISKAELEVQNLLKQLTPVERYAMRFIEETETMFSAEQLAAAEREIEERKREWEENRLAAMREEEKRRVREMEEESDLLTFSREDATNQIWVSNNTLEQMPMWCPPTPPQQDTDVYVDHTMAFLYDLNVMSESQLPPVYVKKDGKRMRHEAGLIDSRRVLKIARKDDSVYAPRSLFERPSPALVKMRRDLKLQKYRGIVRPPVPIPGMKLAIAKPTIEPPCWHPWTIHEDMALLKVIQTLQMLPLNLLLLSPGHTPNWDFVADYVNTVSITYRSPKQCRHRFETVLLPREEGKQLFDNSARKKKNKSGGTALHKFPTQQQNTKNRPMRTSQVFIQDNNSTFSQIMTQRYDTLKGMANKKSMSTKTLVSNPLLKNPKHTAVLNDCGIDLEHPVLPVDVAARRAERIAREKKAMTPEQQLAVAQRLQRIGAIPATGQVVQAAAAANMQAVAAVSQQAMASTAAVVQQQQQQQQQVAVAQPQVTQVSSPVVTTVTTTIVATPNTPTNTLRTQRIIASPLQTPTVVSVSGLSPAQLQAAAQRFVVSAATPNQAKAVVGGTATVAGKTISPAQLQIIRQHTLKQQLRLQTGGITAQAVKTTTIAGHTAVQVQFTQAQPRTQFVRQGPVTVTNKQGITRTVTESEIAQLVKNKQQQLQQQKVLAAVAASSSQSGGNTMQNLPSQVFAQAIQQAGTSGTQVATLVKAGGGTQTVSIPVTAVSLGTAVKALTPTLKTTTPQQLRQLQIQQQQLLAQKKLVNQKITGIAQVAGKGGVATQVIVGSKPLSTAMTMQQFQQVIRSPLTVPQGPVVLAKAQPRVIPVNTGQGGKQTIQVVAATSQGIPTAIRPQVATTLAGALANIKVQGATSSQAQQQLLSQVSAALQSQNAAGIRQNSPVRIQTASGTPIVAVTVQQNAAGNVQVQGSPQKPGTSDSRSDQVSRFLKK